MFIYCAALWDIQSNFQMFMLVKYLHTCRATLHSSAEHDPGILWFLQFNSCLPQSNWLGYIFQRYDREQLNKYYVILLMLFILNNFNARIHKNKNTKTI